MYFVVILRGVWALHPKVARLRGFCFWQLPQYILLKYDNNIKESSRMKYLACLTPLLMLFFFPEIFQNTLREVILYHYNEK